jgi:hypothetical protein
MTSSRRSAAYDGINYSPRENFMLALLTIPVFYGVAMVRRFLLLYPRRMF